MSLSPHLSEKNWGGAGWLEKVGWTSDGLLSMGAFTGMTQMHQESRKEVMFLHSKSRAVERVSDAPWASANI